MAPSDDARWDPQAQRWEWGPRPAPPGEPGSAGDGQAGSGLPLQPLPSQPQPQPQPQPSEPQSYPLQPLPSLPPAPPAYPPWSPQPSAPAPPPPRVGAHPWRGPLLAGVVAAAVAGGGVAAWMLLGRTQPSTAAGGASAPSAVSPAVTGPAGGGPGAPVDASTSPRTSTSPSGSPSAAGPGSTVVRDDAGFSVAVPSGWQRSRDETGSGSFYRLPGDRAALLQIFKVVEDPATGACELLGLSSRNLAGGTSGYRQVSLDPVGGGSACELVYEYDSAESRGRRRGMERIVSTPDGTRWALLAAGPAAESATTRANLTAALDSFRPE
ncbi:hypothetical protein AB0P15_22795 [Streptomyces sp. NPDC087917]|uniref:hypothetical protein n=1 Tax=Streptomyces sp. NPDC087917 TaxID=3155060 RepID=UPI003443384A